MASASSEPLPTIGTDHERVTELEAKLQRSERRREAAEEWAEFLEAELEARDKRLEEVIDRYERLLEEAKAEGERETDEGLWAKLTGWF
jgi:dsDNA-specific endonuclease/ATPase MutS2